MTTRPIWIVASFLFLVPIHVAAQVAIDPLHVPELDAGFHLLYELKPEQSHTQFEAWQKSHPEDPLGAPRRRPLICLRNAIGRAS